MTQIGVESESSSPSSPSSRVRVRPKLECGPRESGNLGCGLGVPGHCGPPVKLPQSDQHRTSIGGEMFTHYVRSTHSAGAFATISVIIPSPYVCAGSSAA